MSLLCFVIAIKRQWCLECILKFEGFARTIDFPQRRDLPSGKFGGVGVQWASTGDRELHNPSFEQKGSGISEHPGSWAHIMLICGTLGVILWLYEALLPGFMNKRWKFRSTEEIFKEASCSHFY